MASTIGVAVKKSGLVDGAHFSATPHVPCVQAMTWRGCAGIASRGATTIPVTSCRWLSRLLVQYRMRQACTPGGVSARGLADTRVPTCGAAAGTDERERNRARTLSSESSTEREGQTGGGKECERESRS